MGSSMSVTLGEGKDDIGVRSRPRLSDLPEFCVACILMRMDPIQICKLARLNCVFSSASSADFIWESKLPSNYSFIIDRLLPDSPPFLNKKRLYSRLCLPISFDNGRKEAWIDKRTGGICISISARGLKITAVDDRRYWTHIPTDESRLGVPECGVPSTDMVVRGTGRGRIPIPTGNIQYIFQATSR